MTLDVAAAVRAGFPVVREALASLVAIPGVSSAAWPRENVRRSAEAVAETLLAFGFEQVRLLETRGHPAVYASLRGPAEGPTILIYGHHDVQPPGREELWQSAPFEASVRDGRIYGRGTADDKGGFLAYAIAARALRDNLPCTVKFLIEGEEEIGSPNLGALLSDERELLACDYAMLCDTPNFDTGVPALTWRLRGNCIVDLEVRCLERPVHSGQGGGLLPDAAAILCSLIARVFGDDGLLRLDSITSRATTDRIEAIAALPFDEQRIRGALGVLDGVRLLPGSSWEQVWTRPSLTITALESVSTANAANQIADSARARLSLRTVRDIDTAAAGEMLAAALCDQPPHGAQVTARVLGGPSWWEADLKHPIFEVARRSLSRAFRSEAVMIGSGGSIGFVKPFADLLGDTPPLLTGVQDPYSNAHSENESLHLGDWEKAMIAATYLLQDLASFHRGSR